MKLKTHEAIYHFYKALEFKRYYPGNEIFPIDTSGMPPSFCPCS